MSPRRRMRSWSAARRLSCRSLAITVPRFLRARARRAVLFPGAAQRSSTRSPGSAPSRGHRKEGNLLLHREVPGAKRQCRPGRSSGARRYAPGRGGVSKTRPRRALRPAPPRSGADHSPRAFGALERLPEALKIREDAGIAPQVIPFYRHPVPWGQGGRRRAMTSPAPRQGGA